VVAIALIGVAVWMQQRPAPAPAAAALAGSTATLTGAAASSPPPPAPTLAHVHVASKPPGAAVSINGEPRGTTPMDVTLPLDHAFVLELSRAGFRPLREELTPHSDLDLRRTLEKGSHSHHSHHNTDPFHRFQ
jgi:hypothetical protein